MAKREGYEVVAPDEDAEANYSHTPPFSLTASLQSRLCTAICVFNISILCLNLFFFAHYRNLAFDISRCVKETSYWSPASESLSHPPETVRFAGLPISNPTWRGEPSPELDAAWTSVTDDVGELPVSREDAVKAGVILDLDTLTEFPERWGGGIYASIEWNHHLHCLNVIRMFARYDHYKDKDTSMKAPHDEIVNHIEHCVDMLRQNVMCNPDPGLIFSYWIKGKDHHHVDFNAPHKCRNFTAVLEWTKEHTKLPTMTELNEYGMESRRLGKGAWLDDYPENLTRGMGEIKGSKWYLP